MYIIDPLFNQNTKTQYTVFVYLSNYFEIEQVTVTVNVHNILCIFHAFDYLVFEVMHYDISPYR